MRHALHTFTTDLLDGALTTDEVIILACLLFALAALGWIFISGWRTDRDFTRRMDGDGR